MHRHHIIPKHIGGSDDPANLIELSIEEHAKAHKKLWEECGRWQDKLAWQMLSGQIGKEEGIKIAQQKAGKRTGSIYGKIWGPLAKELGLGWHGFSAQKRRENGLKTVTMQVGIHHPDFDKSIGGKKGGVKCRDEKLGFHSMPRDEFNAINKNTIWINKGEIERKCREDMLEQFLVKGWQRGRKSGFAKDYKARKIGFHATSFEEKSKQTKGRLWINKNNIRRRCWPHELDKFLSEGWQKGVK